MPESYCYTQNGQFLTEPCYESGQPISTSAPILHIWSEILNKASKISQNKKFLEVGIGKGELLSVALEMGLRWKL